jgi:Flp pilus assembly protein CpaB
MTEPRESQPSFFSAHRVAVRVGVVLGLLVAVGFALFLFYVHQLFLPEEASRFRPVQVAVAVRAIPKGKRIDEADLDFRTIPASRTTGSLVLWPWRVMAVGQEVVADVPRGELLRWSDFDPRAAAPSRSLSPGTVGANVRAETLATVKPGERVKLSSRDRYTAVEAPLLDEARVVAVDGTTGPEPGPDENNDAVIVALIEVPLAKASEVLLAESRGDVVLTRLTEGRNP